MKYATLTPKKTTNRNTLAAVIVVGIVSTLYPTSGARPPTAKNKTSLLRLNNKQSEFQISKVGGTY